MAKRLAETKATVCLFSDGQFDLCNLEPPLISNYVASKKKGHGRWLEARIIVEVDDDVYLPAKEPAS